MTVISDEIKNGKRRQGAELTDSDVGKILSHDMGRCCPCDVGKRCYLRAGVFQMENDQQVAERRARAAAMPEAEKVKTRKALDMARKIVALMKERIVLADDLVAALESRLDGSTS